MDRISEQGHQNTSSRSRSGDHLRDEARGSRGSSASSFSSHDTDPESMSKEDLKRRVIREEEKVNRREDRMNRRFDVYNRQSESVDDFEDRSTSIKNSAGKRIKKGRQEARKPYENDPRAIVRGRASREVPLGVDQRLREITAEEAKAKQRYERAKEKSEKTFDQYEGYSDAFYDE